MFDMDLERKAFITTFSKFTFLTSLSDLKVKNIESIRTLLEIAIEDGIRLGESWREVVLCISQLERLQLFGSDGEQEMQRIQRYVSDKFIPRSSMDEQQRNPRIGAASSPAMNPKKSQSLTITVDRLFTGSVKLSGTAIVDFVRALCLVSWYKIYWLNC
jgi:brefeldin A-inhibited guanine nucleotide-exchange protein